MTVMPTVMLVDDCQDDRMMYSIFLSQKGFCVVSAGDGVEGVNKALQIRPDVVVMDLWLPNMGGWEAARVLKNDERTRDIPIVILTARSFVRAETLGCDACLIKPCPPDVLQAEILRVLGARRKVRKPRPGNTRAWEFEVPD